MKCPPLARMRSPSPCINSAHTMHSVQGRAKCPTVLRRRELVTWYTRTAGQGTGSK